MRPIFYQVRPPKPAPQAGPFLHRRTASATRPKLLRVHLSCPKATPHSAVPPSVARWLKPRPSPERQPLGPITRVRIWHNKRRRKDRRVVFRWGQDLPATEQQRVWVRLAFAALAVALLVTLVPTDRPNSSRPSASITSSPASASSALSVRLISRHWSAVRHRTGADCVAWAAILPVQFVGLMAPLALPYASPASALLAPASPRLPSLFQRPPPAQTL